METEDSSDEDSLESQGDAIENVDIDNPLNASEKTVEINSDDENDSKGSGGNEVGEEVEEEQVEEDTNTEMEVLVEEEVQNNAANKALEIDLGNQDVDKDVSDNKFDMLETESPTQKEGESVIPNNHVEMILIIM